MGFSKTHGPLKFKMAEILCVHVEQQSDPGECSGYPYSAALSTVPGGLRSRRLAALMSRNATCSGRSNCRWISASRRYKSGLLRSPCIIEQWLDSCEEYVGENLPHHLPQIQLGGLGERCKLPQRVGSRHRPATKRILVQRRQKLGIRRWVDGFAKWVNIYNRDRN